MNIHNKDEVLHNLSCYVHIWRIGLAHLVAVMYWLWNRARSADNSQIAVVMIKCPTAETFPACIESRGRIAIMRRSRLENSLPCLLPRSSHLGRSPPRFGAFRMTLQANTSNACLKFWGNSDFLLVTSNQRLYRIAPDTRTQKLFLLTTTTFKTYDT